MAPRARRKGDDRIAQSSELPEFPNSSFTTDAFRVAVGQVDEAAVVTMAPESKACGGVLQQVCAPITEATELAVEDLARSGMHARFGLRRETEQGLTRGNKAAPKGGRRRRARGRRARPMVASWPARQQSGLLQPPPALCYEVRASSGSRGRLCAGQFALCARCKARRPPDALPGTATTVHCTPDHASRIEDAMHAGHLYALPARLSRAEFGVPAGEGPFMHRVHPSSVRSTSSTFTSLPLISLGTIHILFTLEISHDHVPPHRSGRRSANPVPSPCDGRVTRRLPFHLHPAQVSHCLHSPYSWYRTGIGTV